ncbi:hypothetical protein ACHMW6_29170 [Pseudoduganella sp. UC29_106]|uniref:hypothetical protein n=1 Tax=Pseudoduganella sp. UC29_106 TaxID=3374553 RepID=UPI0037565666
MEQPPEDIVARQDEQAKAIPELSCQVRLLTQRTETGFRETNEAIQRQDARISEVKTDLSKRVDDVSKRIDLLIKKVDFYARVFLGFGGALVAAVVGKIVNFW